MNKVFCPTCGELVIKNGEIVHTEHDKIIIDILENGFYSTPSYKEEEIENHI